MIKYLLLLLPLNCFALEQDKALHLTVSYGATVSGVYFFEKQLKVSNPDAQIFTSFLVITAGALKERYDEKFDVEDMKYNALGVATGCVFTWVF
jgi:hypothetical protein